MADRVKKNKVKFAINHVANTVNVATTTRSDIDTDLENLITDYDYYENDFDCIDSTMTQFQNSVSPQSGEMFTNNQNIIIITITDKLAIIANDDIDGRIIDLDQFSESRYDIGSWQNERTKFRAKLDL
jgi:hypothetical protein